MSLLFYSVAALGVLVTVLVILSQVAFWQRKEYRLDRAAAALRHEPHVQKSAVAYVLLVLIVFAGLVLFPKHIAALLTGFCLAVLLLAFAYRIVRRGVSRPDPTPKAVLIVLLSSFLLVWLAWLLIAWSSLPWLLLIIVTVPVVILSVSAVHAGAGIKKQMIIHQATRYRRRLTGLAVIGITGSYGKTSTKYFLAHILQTAGYKVRATAKHRNAEFPVAQDLLTVPADTDVYVVEMAAYRRGEIAALCRLTQPTIGVITAISNQHVGLFGSREKLAAAKWELVHGVANSGMVVLNDDDATIKQQPLPAHVRVIKYSASHATDVWISDYVYEPQSTTLTLHIGGASADITIPTPGEGMTAAAVAAAAAAYAHGLSLTQITPGLTTLTVPAQTMEVVPGVKGSLVIDDSYSANEVGVEMALRHLQRFSSNHKIVVLPVLIELGSETTAVHQRLGQALAACNADVFIYGTGRNVRALREAGGSAANTWYDSPDPEQLSQAISDKLTSDTVILLAGRVPEKIRQRLRPDILSQ